MRHDTLEPRSTDTRLIRTPGYYGQFRLSRRKAHTFSLKLICLKRKPVNSGQRTLLRVPIDKMSYIANPASRTLSEYHGSYL